MNVGRIRGFLLQAPKPALVRVLVDGEAEDIKTGRTSYQKMAESIAALQGEELRCFDADGKLLRAMRLDDVDANRVADGPAIPAILAQDPQAALLSLFANELARAYQFAAELAFNKMVETFDRVNDRSQGIEQRLERAEAYARRLREEQARDAIEQAEDLVAAAAEQEGGGDLGSHLAQAFLSGRLNRDVAAPKPNGHKSNGAPKPNGKGGAA